MSCAPDGGPGEWTGRAPAVRPWRGWAVPGVWPCGWAPSTTRRRSPARVRSAGALTACAARSSGRRAPAVGPWRWWPCSGGLSPAGDALCPARSAVGTPYSGGSPLRGCVVEPLGALREGLGRTGAWGLGRKGPGFRWWDGRPEKKRVLGLRTGEGLYHGRRSSGHETGRTKRMRDAPTSDSRRFDVSGGPGNLDHRARSFAGSRLCAHIRGAPDGFLARSFRGCVCADSATRPSAGARERGQSAGHDTGRTCGFAQLT